LLYALDQLSNRLESMQVRIACKTFIIKMLYIKQAGFIEQNRHIVEKWCLVGSEGGVRPKFI